VRARIAALAALLAVSTSGGARAADTGFLDVICPEATQSVVALRKLTKDDGPQRVYDAAQAATNAYQRCSADKLTHGFREPQHYADARGASFALLAARALIALHRADEARRELQQWRPRVQEVVDWQTEAVPGAQGHKPKGESEPDVARVTPGDHDRSIYFGVAKEIIGGIDAQLARIEALRARNEAQSASTPAPSATP
jgi:hypothetical protein